MRFVTRVLSVATIAGLFIPAGMVGAGETAMRVQRVDRITVDGNLGDWKDVAVQPLQDGLAIGAVAQDDHFLYVNFSFTDLALARRVLRSGAIVWFNAAGKHEADIGLRYRGTDDLQKTYDTMVEAAGPEALAAAQAQPWRGNRGNRGNRANRAGGATGAGRAARQPLGTLEVLHHGVSDTVIANGKTPDDVSAACNVVDSSFVYELRLPLKEIVAADPTAAAGGEHTIAIGFQMSGSTPADRAARNAGGGGRWRQQQPGSAAPWASAPDAQNPAPAPATAAPAAPQTAAGAPTAADASAAAGAPAAAGAATAPAAAGGTPQRTQATARARNTQPTWFDMIVLLPKAEPQTKQE